MINKNLLIIVIIIFTTHVWATNKPTTNSMFNDTLTKPITIIDPGKEITSDFTLPSHGWSILSSKDLRGKHEIFDIKNEKEHLFLYRVGPRAEIGIKEHDDWEEVVIINGTLEWLNPNGQTQQILGIGAYVNRSPHTKHGPFRAGNKGCLMYVRMYS
ncbi:TPA: hypothetical protein ACT7HB_002076 [Legionella pneumophila]